jgi:hypothetical protein
VPLLGHFPAYARDPLGFVTRVSAEYGGVVLMRLGPFPALLLTDPDAIDEVLVAKHRDFRKSRTNEGTTDSAATKKPRFTLEIGAPG